jgi:hypothetical protein
LEPSSVRQVGPYRVRRLHAEGGQAWIFEVDDPKFEARRALKALKPQAGPSSAFERFRREAQSLASLSHPNLIAPYDFGRDEATGWFYYTMAFVEGQTLAGRLGSGGPLTLAELRAVFVPVLDALAAVHRAGFVHRDIKPSNILLSTEGHPYLGDLGIVIGTRDEERTQTGVALGTALYMSPEQARGRREEIGPASDVFSLGLVIYEALTGRSAYAGTEVEGGRSAEILMYLGARLYRGQELELSLPDEVPAPLQRFVRKACRLSQGERFAGAREMRDAFIEALDRAEGRGTRPPSPWLRLFASRRGRIAIGAFALCLGVAAGWLAYRSWTAAGRAGPALERAAAQGEEVAKLLAAAPIPDSQLDIGLRLAERGARFELDAARAYRADGLDEAALARAERAQLRFDDVCARLGYALQARLLETTEALERRSGAYEGDLPEALRASRLLPGPAGDLAKRIAALRGPPERKGACEIARAHLARLQAVPALEAAQAELQRALDPKLAGAIRALRDEAQAARARAQPGIDVHRAARARFEAGERALAAGEEEQRKGALFPAARAYSAARAAFDQVPAMQPALGATLAY